MLVGAAARGPGYRYLSAPGVHSFRVARMAALVTPKVQHIFDRGGFGEKVVAVWSGRELPCRTLVRFGSTRSGGTKAECSAVGERHAVTCGP